MNGFFAPPTEAYSAKRNVPEAVRVSRLRNRLERASG